MSEIFFRIMLAAKCCPGPCAFDARLCGRAQSRTAPFVLSRPPQHHSHILRARTYAHLDIYAASRKETMPHYVFHFCPQVVESGQISPVCVGAWGLCVRTHMCESESESGCSASPAKCTHSASVPVRRCRASVRMWVYIFVPLRAMNSLSSAAVLGAADPKVDPSPLVRCFCDDAPTRSRIWDMWTPVAVSPSS